MTAGQRQWPGFHQDREPARMEQERQREQQIRADNLSARIQAQFAPDRIDPSIGRTFGDAAARSLYDDDAGLQRYRDLCDRARNLRERLRWAQARTAGRQGRN